MKVLSPKQVKETLEKLRDFDPALVDPRIEDLINKTIIEVKGGNKDVFNYNPYLKSYLLILKHKKFIIFGIEKDGFDTLALARRDALKTLRDIQRDKIPDYSVKRIVTELIRLDSGMERKRNNEERRLRRFIDERTQ